MKTLQPLIAAITLLTAITQPAFSSESKTSREIIAQADETVILIHGLGRTCKSMRKMEQHLKTHGYAVVNIDYPSTRFDIAHLSTHYLAPVIEKAQQDSTPLHFVTHSMGGILIRHYLATHPHTSTGRIVMLAPPNQGSEIIDVLGNFSIFRSTLGPAAQQLSTRNDSLPNSLPALSQEIGIIAGKKSFNPLFSHFIRGADDGKVSVTSTRLPEMKDHLVLNVGHTFIMTDKNVLNQATHFLKTGTFNQL